MVNVPETCLNFINGREVPATKSQTIEKMNPHSGELLCRIARSSESDVIAAVDAAKAAQKAWGALPVVKRGEILFAVADLMSQRREELASIVAVETGKSKKDALGEVGGAIALCRFMAGEGQRMFGRTTTSGVVGRLPMIIREPIGVVGLIAAANTPIANVAWKAFPALICGNSAVMKPSEDAPIIATVMARLMTEAGVPAGVFNIVHGLGLETGAPLVGHPDVALISFTGSTGVGRAIAETVGRRMGRVSLELGGKNPLVVFDDSDLPNAVSWAVLSSFSNAGQRCASSSRLLIQEGVYEKFKQMLVEKTTALKVGPSDHDDFGPVINARQLEQMLAAIEQAKADGVKVLTGGERLKGPQHSKGYYLAPTILEGATPSSTIAQKELFGPITCLFRFKDLKEAIALSNNSSYGLTAAVHTQSYKTALAFSIGVQSGLVQINAGTYGSEPHMPFGGVKQSGNGSREPGPEALDVYSNLKVISHNFDLINV